MTTNLQNEFTYEGKELDLFAYAQNWKAYQAKRMAPWIQGRVLEVGAGIGSNTLVLAASPAISHFTCLEPDVQLATQLEARLAQAPWSGKITVGKTTIQALDPACKFDTILYLDVLEHIPDDQLEIHTAGQHLNAGGRLIVLSPAFPFLFSEFDAAIGHKRRYTKSTLLPLAPPDCSLEFTSYLDSLGALLSMANRLFLKQKKPTLSQIRFWDSYVIPPSRITDLIIGRWIGRSIIAVWKKH